MKTKVLVTGAIAIAALIAGGWAVAQSAGLASGLGPAFMHGQGLHGMGARHNEGNAPAMGNRGPGMMKGMGMMR